MISRAPLSFRSIRSAFYASKCRLSSLSSSSKDTLTDILTNLQQQKIDVTRARELINLVSKHNNALFEEDTPKNNDDILESFANSDHGRTRRTGFPEAVFAQGKTPKQVAMILDDMARHVNEMVGNENSVATAILATRVTSDMYKELVTIPLNHGVIEYHETARIVSMMASSCQGATTSIRSDIDAPITGRVVVVTAGTTDQYVAEEAAVTLHAAGCHVDRIQDSGVAGLHRIIRALPRLRHVDVDAVIVCAGMDGALPSVLAGLVSVPVVAVPTSIGYGASFGGVSAMLTMLNSCSPGVGVVNIDNGFGAAALVYKMILRKKAERYTEWK